MENKKENEKTYLDLEYEFDGCGDYDKPIEYSEQYEEFMKKLFKSFGKEFSTK